MLGKEPIGLALGLGLLGTVAMIGATSADEPNCDALYERLKTEAGGDPSRCEQPIVDYQLQPCEPPQHSNDPRVPAQVILALDASGSMAGMTGNETKMEAAKREAMAFMQALETDVPVGLVVYGHTGDNTESGKADSCRGIEWVQTLGAGTNAAINHVNGLQPVGWTPLADTLAFLETELADHPAVMQNGQDIDGPTENIPVVYLISDGEETCGGDPVGAARSLSQSGVQAVINVIGFDVDDETRRQLEQISEAGGGRYLIANDARELREQLEAEQRNRLSISDYRRCTDKNQSTVLSAYNKAIISIQECFRSESYTKSMEPISRIMRQHTEQKTPESVCYSDVVGRAGDDFEAASQREEAIYEALRQEQDARVNEID